MIHIRPYKNQDAHEIIQWCKDEEAYFKWNAGMFGDYPLTEKRFILANDGLVKNKKMFPFTAFYEDRVIGYFILREVDTGVLRVGFVILAPELRQKGYGKKMLELGLKFAFELYGATKVTIGVFENNPAAYYCYKRLGFKEIGVTEDYKIKQETWKCIEMELKIR